MAKGLSKLPGSVKNLYNKLTPLFEMDKAIKKSGLQMGLLGTQSKAYQATIKEASYSTNELGMGVKQLAEMQASYSEELGRAVQLGEKGLMAMSEMASATVLGAEGAAKMASQMDTQGYSAERTAKFVEQTMDDSTKMGLNASKVIKNIQNNIKLLNKYNFKGGVKGLAKMAATASKLGIDMNAIYGMANKLFDIEGAVDMSAQLQVLGGEWSKLADPFKLMYMARNDMEGLTAAMGAAAEGSVHFNNTAKTFEISALEMHKLRKVAEQTGVAYDDLAEMGKRAAKYTRIKKQLAFDIDPKMQEFLTNQAQWDEKGKATIEINSSTKLLETLSKSDRGIIRAQMLESESIAERAKNAQTFDDKFNNLINMMKTSMLPVVDGLNEVLGPLVKDIFANDDFKGEMKALGVSIGGFVKGAATIGKWVGELVLGFGPIKTLVTMGLFKAAQWISNGKLLAIGFNMGSAKDVNGVNGGFSNMLGSGGKNLKTGANMMKSGKTLRGLGRMTKGLGKIAAPIALIGVAIDGITNSMDSSLSTSDKWLKTLDQNKGMAAGAVIGTMIAPGVGTAIGMGIGGIVDMLTPEMGEYGKKNEKISYGGSANDAILSQGKLTKLNSKDDLLAYKPNGPIDNKLKGNNSTDKIKVEFGEMHIKFDELKVSTPGSPGLSIDLLKNDIFIRELTNKVHIEVSKAINGGKVKPS